VQVPTIIYEGYSDREGAWGVYRGDRRTAGQAAFESALSRGQQPRVFRLFRRQDEGSDENENDEGWTTY